MDNSGPGADLGANWDVDRSATDRGSTEASGRSLRRVVRKAALSVSGSVEHTSGLNRLTGRSYPRVEVGTGKDRVDAEVHIAAEWPSPVTHLAATVREAIHEVLKAHTGAESIQVDVHVGAVVPGPVALDEVALPLAEPKTDSRLAPQPVATPSPPSTTTPQRPAPKNVRQPEVPDLEFRSPSSPAPAKVQSVSTPTAVRVTNPTAPNRPPLMVPSAPVPEPIRHPSTERTEISHTTGGRR